jgi:transcriptional regulator with XRE-family HTH domain
MRTRVGGVILELRTQQGMSLSLLAERAGISQSHLGRIERGTTMPSYSVVADLARALNTNLSVFTSYTDRASRADAVIEEVLSEAGVPEQDLDVIFHASLTAREMLAKLLVSNPSPYPA